MIPVARGSSLHGQPWNSSAKTRREITTTSPSPSGLKERREVYRHSAEKPLSKSSRIDDGPAMRPQRGHVASNGVGESTAYPKDERLMSAFGNERLANAVPPFEEGSEFTLRALFFYKKGLLAESISKRGSALRRIA